ncbi:MAG: hypothetical protein HUK00_08565 [Bacteroidaceae bacterium]|nr:hypothetical protein [Bacteroidaceae bacterium]
MKKEYMQPTLDVYAVEAEQMLQTSPSEIVIDMYYDDEIDDEEEFL